MISLPFMKRLNLIINNAKSLANFHQPHMPDTKRQGNDDSQDRPHNDS